MDINVSEERFIMKKLNITKEQFNRSNYFQRKYGKLKYVSESGRYFKTSKGKVLKFNEGFMSNMRKDGQHLYSIIYKFDGWDGSVQEYGKTEEDAIQAAIAKGKLDGDEDIVKIVDLGEQHPKYTSLREGNEMKARFNESFYGIPGAKDVDWAILYKNCKIEPSEFYGNLGELYDEEHPEDPNHEGFDDWCWENTDLIKSELEHLASYDDDYEGDDYYAESKKIVNEGPGAAYTVTIKNAKLDNVKVEKNGDGDWEFEADIVKDTYMVEAADYYNLFCPMDSEFDGEEWVEVAGKVRGVCWWYDDEWEVESQIEGTEQDISFMYGHGWLHANLPEDGHIESDSIKSKGHDTWEIQSIELNAPQLAECVNYCHDHFLDEDEPEEDEDDQFNESRYMSDDDIAGQYKGWWFSEFGPVEVGGNKLAAGAWIEFPSADGEDFDSGRGLWFVKGMDEDDYPREQNDVWMEPETAREVKEVARLLMNAKVNYLSFNSAEEFHKYMDEFKKGSDRSRFAEESEGKDISKKKIMNALDEFTQVLWDDTKVKGKKEHELRRSFFDETVHAISTAIQKYFKYTRM